MLRLSFSLKSIQFSFTWVLTITALSFASIQENVVADTANDQILGNRFGKSVLVFEPPADPLKEELGSDTCSWGTHDSCPEVRIAQQSKKAKTRPKPIATKQDSHRVEEALATITASVGSSVGISVQQIIEPFAMVSPSHSSTLDEIEWLAKFWNHSESVPFSWAIDADSITYDAPDASTAQDDVDFDVVSIVPFVDFDGLFESQHSTASLASAANLGSHLSIKSRDLNRIDWQSHDDHRFNLVGSDDVNELQQDTPGLQVPSDNVETGKGAVASLAKDAIAVGIAAVSKGTQEADSRQTIQPTRTHYACRRLAGSSGFVATIDQVLLPYDFLGGSQPMRNLFPLGSGGYCMLERASLEEMEAEPSVESIQAMKVSQDGQVDEATHMLSQTISAITSTLNRNPQWRRLFRAKNYGRQFGWLTAHSFESSSQVLENLASHWPLAPVEVESAGSQLLARAEAIDEVPAVISQLDQVRIDQLRQTVVTLLDKATMIQSWFRLADRSHRAPETHKRNADQLR